MKYSVKDDIDFVFLSFDEPNAEMLYAELCNMIPWCKRVHGVKGFDAAHRACASASDTHFFVTVDGDNRIYPEFLNMTVDINKDENDHAWTWAGRNHINGLVYGNGGLKLWSKTFVNNMNSHENAIDKSHSIDFCWKDNYHEEEGCYSETYSNGSPYQAWRSGFREGVKMSLDRGNRVLPTDFHKKIWYGNVNRLNIWATVGQDVDNGIWAIYGTRMGCYLTSLTDKDYTIISDYNEMDRLWQEIKNNDPIKESISLGDELQQKLGLNLTMLDDNTSTWFKSVYMNPLRPWISEDRIKHFMATKHA